MEKEKCKYEGLLILSLIAGAVFGVIVTIVFLSSIYPALIEYDVNWSGWFQAIGSIAAVGSGFFVNAINQKKEQRREIDDVLSALHRLEEMIGQGALVSVYQEKGKTELDAIERARQHSAGKHQIRELESGYSCFFEESKFSSSEFFFLVKEIRSKQFKYLGPRLIFKIKTLMDEMEVQGEKIEEIRKKHDVDEIKLVSMSSGVIVTIKNLPEVVNELQIRRSQV